MINVYISSNKEIGRKCKAWALKNLPKKFKIVENINECNIFISVLYDKILNNSFIKTRRCYNFHPGKLPEYGGVGTITWSILNGEKYHGITLHLIDSGIDTGDIINTTRIKISEKDTAYSLHEKVMDKMFLFFKQNLCSILEENYTVKKQDISKTKVYTYSDLDKLLDLTTYARATYFPDKNKPFYYKSDKKTEINIEL